MTETATTFNTVRSASRLNHSPFWAMIELGQSMIDGGDDLFSISVATTVAPYDSKTLDRYMTDGILEDKAFGGYIMAKGSGSIVHMVSADSLVYAVEFCMQSLADAGNLESVISFPLPVEGLAALAILERAGMVNRFRNEMGVVHHVRGRFAIEASGNELYFKQLSKPVSKGSGSKKVSDFYPSVALLERQPAEDGYSHHDGWYH